MHVLRFVLRRLIMLILTLFVASFAIYSAMYLAPGNPIAALTGGRTPTPQAIAVLEERYHLNDPFLVRYVRWLGSAFSTAASVRLWLRCVPVATTDRASAMKASSMSSSHSAMSAQFSR